ncbi:MAG: hypothetical protein HY763_11960 [Planctomycetes bacterium]|nr:hypothetical protein [Planctomycetota bacterium]
MQARMHRVRRWVYWFCGGALALQAAGCQLTDPDIPFQFGLSLASDAAIFLLENLVASF